MKSYLVPFLAVIAAVSLIVNVLLFFRWSPSRPAVTVGGTVITKKDFQNHLEYEDGQSVLTKLVFASIVTQAAQKAGMMPTDGDVEGRIALINRQAPQLLAPYSRDSVKMAQFRQDLATSMALENLRIQNVALSPAQVSDYYSRHQKEFALPQQTETTTVIAQNAVDAQTAADLLRASDPPDVIARQRGLRVVGVGGYSPDLQTLPTAFRQQTTDWAMKAASGAIKTFQMGGFYLTFRVTGRRPAVVPPLSEVRGEVEHAARLELAPSQAEELARLYRNANPSFSSDKYAGYFAAVEQYPAAPDTAKKTADNAH